MHNPPPDNSFWWKTSVGADVHDVIYGYVEYLKDLSRAERQKDRIHSLLYHSDDVFGPAYASALNLLKSANGGIPVKLNISKNIVDTLTAKIAKNHPAIKVATDGAQWDARLKGKRLGKFINAKLSETRFRRLSPIVFRDCLIRGTGIVKVTADNGEILPERVLKSDIHVDPFEARHGKPRQLHQTYTVAREVVAELFPEKRAEIMMADSVGRSEDESWDTLEEPTDNMLRVVESWHLPSGPDADDGRHAICLQDVTLVHEAWDRPRFPFAFIHWSAPDQGFWGSGLVEELAPIQWEIDNTIQCIQESLRIGARMKVILQRGSKVVKSQLNNKIGAIIETSGPAPMFQAPNPVSEQLFVYLNLLYDKSYEISGLSQLSAQSKLPSQMGDSAIAIQTFYDIETERFSQQALAYRNLYLDTSELYIDTAKSIYDSDADYSGNWADRSLVERIPWGKVDMKRDQFILQLEAINFLPETRAGKLAALKELHSIGIIPADLVGPTVESPDLERVYRSVNASYDNIDSIIEKLEDVDKDMPEPEPFHNLQLGIQLVKAAYNEAQATGAPDSVLERFQEWLLNANAVLSPPAPEGQPPAAAAAPGAPTAQEGAAPPAPSPNLAAPPSPPALPPQG